MKKPLSNVAESVRALASKVNAALRALALAAAQGKRPST